MAQLIERDGIRRRGGGAIRSCCGCAGPLRREGQTGRLPREYAKVSQAVRACFEDGNLDNDFGPRFVNIGDHFFRERQLVRGVSNNDSVLAVDLTDALKLEQLAQ